MMSRSSVRHALRDGAALREWIQKAKTLLVLADYDGTLVPIKPSPDQARPTARTRTLLRRLSRLPGVRLGIVSGRALDELRRLVGISGLIYVGNHGFEIRGSGIRFVHPGARRSVPLLQRISRQLQAALRSLEGALVEPKRLSLSVHWRKVAARDMPRFHERVEAVLAPWRVKRAVRVTRGKRVIEVRPPVPWGKGKAVGMVMQHERRDGRAMYLGDDQTDEDAFRAVNRRRGVSVFVGQQPQATAARWWLKGPREVEVFIRQVIAAR